MAAVADVERQKRRNGSQRAQYRDAESKKRNRSDYEMGLLGPGSIPCGPRGRPSQYGRPRCYQVRQRCSHRPACRARRFQDDSNLSSLPGYDMADIGLSVSNDSGVTVRALVNNVTNEVGLTEGNARAAVLGTGTVGDATVGAIHLRPQFHCVD